MLHFAFPDDNEFAGMTAKTPLVLVDGSSYLYRAFHALPPLTNSKGQPTGAVKGVISMLRRLEKDYPDSPIAVIFDAKGKTFRDELFAEYKANRPPMPDDLRAQIQPIHDIVDAMGLPRLVIEGVEADDVIGTLAAQAEADRPVVVSTGDKDMAQLVNAHVTLVNTMTDTRMDEAGVEAKFGIPPSLIIDFLALMGDKIDNIPGVPGVGEKTALALLQALGGIRDIYARLDEVPTLEIRGAKSLAKKLEDSRDAAELSYELATIKCDVALDVSIADLQHQPADNSRLLTLFRELEFKGWTDELLRDADASVDDEVSTAPAALEKDYQVVTDAKQFEAWLDVLRKAALFAFDTETTSLNYMQARVVGVSFAVEAGTAAYVPFGHDYIDAPEQLSEEQVLGALKPLLEDPDKAKLGQNLKYDANVLKNHGITLRGIAEDVNAKALRVCALCNGVADRWLLQLYGGIAVLADKEMPGVAMSWVSAADKGVQ